MSSQPEPLGTLRVTGADGVQLNVLEWSREGVPMLLIHGFSNEAHIWDDFAPHVRDFYRVLAIDLRGHGDSDWASDGAYDYDDHVADLEALYEALGIERAVIVAHSLGGRVTTLFAGKHPEKMAGFVIVDSAPELDRRGTIRISQDVQQHRDPSFGSPAEYETYLAHAYPAARPHTIVRMARHGLKQREDGRWILKMDTTFRGAAAGDAPDPEKLKQREIDNTARLWEALEKIPCPTLVVRGAASDILSADVADRMAEDVLPNGSLAVIGQSGHSVMTDNPDGFREAVCRFVLGE